MKTVTVTISIIFILTISSVECSKPNILVILADDLGYNDVGYRGNNQVKTPNIDALAYNGAILERFYTLPTCTPSRTAILTGNYPIRLGFQGMPISEGEERHLPHNMPTLPERLKTLGYKTHLVGKWHLGFAWRNVTPTERGFDTHYGYYSGFIGYFDHEVGWEMKGLDFRENFAVCKSDTGKYATDLFTNRTVQLIKNHDQKQPFFILLSHLAVHTGKSIGHDKGMMEERDTARMNKNFGYIKDIERRRYVDVLKTLDESVGTVIKSLAQKKILDNTIILFLSDNGAPTYGEIYKNFGSNWPLRGMKVSHFEGGVRGTAVFYSKKMAHKRKINSNLIHVTDLLPTFYAAGGGNVTDLGKLDGVNQLDTLMTNGNSKRTEVLVNIDEKSGSQAIIGNGGRYKLVKGIQFDGFFDAHRGVSGRLPEDGDYDINAVLRSDVNEAMGYSLKANHVRNIRKMSTVKNCRKQSPVEDACELCLFNLEEDPCETTNIASTNDGLVNNLAKRLQHFYEHMVPSRKKDPDPRANPKYFGGVWAYWLDKFPISEIVK